MPSNTTATTAEGQRSALSVLLGRRGDDPGPDVPSTALADARRCETPADPRDGEAGTPSGEVGDRACTSIFSGGGPDLSPRPPAESLVGGKYQVLDPLGRGGTARVFRVRHVLLGRDFALKVLDDAAEVPQRLRRVFQREAQVASKLDHPNIIQLIDYGSDPRYGLYLVMELLRGETLADRLGRTGPLRSSLVVELSLQIAEAPRYLHGQGVVHGDVKAENLLLCPNPGDGRSRLRVKLIDFGMARARASNLRLADTEISGTPQYVAPELLRHYPPQPTMDIYSLGVLMYEMLTSETPFNGSVGEILQAQLHHEPTPPSELIPTPVESRLEELVLDCLDKDPGSRPRSMENVIYQLRTIAQMYGFGSERAASPPRAAAPDPAAQVFRALGEDCPCPQCTLSGDGAVTWANGACAELLRSSPAELLGRKAEDTLLGAILPGIQADIRRVLTGDPPAALQRPATLGSRAGGAAWTMWLYPVRLAPGSNVRLAILLHPSR